MIWFFRIVGLTLALFVAVCLTGLFLPSTQRVDTLVSLPADAEDVYAVLSDLRTYPEWSALGGAQGSWVFGGSETGVGQSAAWQNGNDVGSAEIVQAAPGEFVRVRLIGATGKRMLTFALTETSQDTDLLIQSERQLGGFPFIGRIAGWRQSGTVKAELDLAAQGLADLFR